MPATFASGETTNRFDTPVGEDVKKAMNDAMNRMTTIEREIEYLGDKIESLTENLQGVTNNIEQITSRADYDRLLFDMYKEQNKEPIYCWCVFAYSSLGRFLNFFGCWWIYGSDGNLYPNVTAYADKGKVPFFTRVKRKVSKIFHVLKDKA